MLKITGLGSRIRSWRYQFQLRRLERKITKKETLEMLREAFRDLDMPIDHLNDDEFRAGAMQLGETLYTTGMTVDEAAGSLEQVVRAMQRQEAGGL